MMSRGNIASFLVVCLLVGCDAGKAKIQVMTNVDKPCSFPFVYWNGITYDCAYGRGGLAWCAVTPNYEFDKFWGYCDATKSPPMKTFGGNADEANCVFPFNFKGKEYKYCILTWEMPWCSTTKDYDKDQKWGFCPGYNSDNRFRQFSPKHVGALSFGDTEALTTEERTEIVDLHNQLRNDVSPSAKNMMKLRYDRDLENLARKWVNTCKPGHPEVNSLPGVVTLGQNAFSSGGPGSWKQAIMAWHGEVTSFKYGSGVAKGPTGHYTQEVWASSTMVGCAKNKKCKGKSVYVCNYGPSGNMPPAYKPYEKGSPDCKKRDSKYRNLCVCDIESCENFATLNPKTCTCPCKKGQVAPRCSVDCSIYKDPPYCQTTYKGGCLKYANVQFDCPWMCGICTK